MQAFGIRVYCVLVALFLLVVSGEEGKIIPIKPLYELGWSAEVRV